MSSKDKFDSKPTKIIVNLVVSLISIVIAILIFTKVIKMSDEIGIVVGVVLILLSIYYIYSSLILYKDIKKEKTKEN